MELKEWSADRIMKKDLFFDIETIPNINPREYSENIDIKAPGNYKDSMKIEEYIAEKRISIVNDIIKAASLNPIYGRIISIAIRHEGQTFCKCSEVEDDIINYVSDFICERDISWRLTRLITFNGKAFDVPFFNIRAKQQILPDVSKYQQEAHFDVLLYVNNFGSFHNSLLSLSQQAIAKILGVPEGIGSGSEVYNYYIDNDFDKIVQHNISDVNQLEKICIELGISKNI